MQALNPTPALHAALDWPSLGWAALLLGITFAVLAVKARYPVVAKLGLVPRVIAHACVGYYGVGMAALGMSAVASGHMPVPGGAAWDGPIAIIGGFAALVAGSITLGEHVAAAWSFHFKPVPAEVPVEVTAPRG